MKTTSLGSMIQRVNSLLLIIVFLHSGSLFAQKMTPTTSLSASSLTGDPGDIITFAIDEQLQGMPLDRRELTFDGHDVSKTWGKTHEWKAEPGTHILRLYIRWIDGKNEAGRPHKLHLQKMLTVRISGWEKKGGYNHPGLIINEKELDVIRKNISGPDPHPMKAGWKSLAPDLNYVPQAIEVINMHNVKADRMYWDKDGWAAYYHALKWAIGGDERYGAKAAEILNAWGNTCKQMFLEDEDVYQFLHGTNSMNRWLNAAELLKHAGGGYKGWKKNEIERFDQNYVRGCLVPIALGWPGNIGSPYGTQNQPLYVVVARVYIGIYLDDEAMFMSGYNYFFKKNIYQFDDLGTKPHLADMPENDYLKVFGERPINLFELSIGRGGEYMEINRDPGHTNMCIHAIQKIAEPLRHQGYDDVYQMKFLNEETPRYLQSIYWLSDATLGSGARTTNKGKIELQLGRLQNIEQVYNYYHYILKDKYPLPERLVRYINQRRARGEGNLDMLLYADLAKND